MASAGATALKGQTFHPDYLDGNLYLKLEDTTTVNLAPYPFNIPALNLIMTAFGVDTIYRPFQSGHPDLQNIYRLEFTSILGTDNLIAQLGLLGFVDFAEKVPLIRTVGTATLPNDLQLSQWGLTKIQAEMAWTISQGSSTVKVAIVDNAERITHEDLGSVIWTNPNEVPNNFFDDDLNGYPDDAHGFDVADFDANVNPPTGITGWDHGTHCAGIAGAATNNGVGIASIGYGISIIPVKAANNAAGGNTLAKAFEGVDYARAAGADVISMSWGSKGTSAIGDLILSLASNQGIVLVAAAGNNGDSILFYPAANPLCIAVGSTDINDLRSPFSNFGSYVDVMAPGSDIYSCLAGSDNDYGN
ncbi:MAG TPA: S8 family serine peptidase, partial [Bacteroidia bacterium]|nr:S8 family serine peptidase [Bacteroidia bacterium]